MTAEHVLTKRQLAFAKAYARLRDRTEAAKVAGFPPERALEVGRRLALDPRIRALAERLRREGASVEELDAD